MTTTDIRAAIYTLIERHITNPFADDEAGRWVLRQADDACELLAAWLDAQPEAPDAPEHWEPVEDGCHGNVRQRAGILYLDMGIEDDERIILLPAGYALCRRYLRDGEY